VSTSSGDPIKQDQLFYDCTTATGGTPHGTLPLSIIRNQLSASKARPRVQSPTPRGFKVVKGPTNSFPGDGFEGRERCIVKAGRHRRVRFKLPVTRLSLSPTTQAQRPRSCTSSAHSQQRATGPVKAILQLASHLGLGGSADTGSGNWATDEGLRQDSTDCRTALIEDTSGDHEAEEVDEDDGSMMTYSVPSSLTIPDDIEERTPSPSPKFQVQQPISSAYSMLEEDEWQWEPTTQCLSDDMDGVAMWPTRI
jgi:hypothetical protein